VTQGADDPKSRRNTDFRKRNTYVPRLFDLARFALFSGLTILAALLAGTGRVAYVFVMLVIAAALAYAVLDLVGYELAKRTRRS
jgi:VanZ family protein